MTKDIHLIRHGITQGLKEKFYYGSTDLPLLPEGFEELSLYRKKSIYPQADRYFCSPMTRTVQTLHAIYGEVDYSTIDALREFDFGVFEMRSYAQMENDADYQQYMEAAIKGTPYTCPYGENTGDFQSRVLNGWQTLLQSASTEAWNNAVVVTHGGVIGVLMATLFPDIKHFYQWVPESGLGYTVHFRMIEPEGTGFASDSLSFTPIIA